MQSNLFSIKTVNKNKSETETPIASIQSPFKNKKIAKICILACMGTLIQYGLIRSCSQTSSSSTLKRYAIITTKKSISKGDTLNENNTQLVYFPVGEFKNEFILNSQFDNYIGKKVMVNLDNHSPIFKSMVQELEDSSIPHQIPPGKRFYTLPIDLSNMAAILKVGDRVDIVAEMNLQGFGKASETILNGLKVIGIGQQFNEGQTDENANSLSFYVSPEEAKILSFMKDYSQFSVLIRNPNDHSLSEQDPITFNKFLQNEKIQKILQNDSFRIIEGKSIKHMETK